MRRLLSGEKVTTESPWPVHGARIGPLPPGPVEVWIGASAPRAIDRAARLGDAWLASPALTLVEARVQIDLYRERCAAHGRVPTAIPIRRDIHVGADAADVERVAGPVLAAGYRGFPPDAPVVGTVEQVATRFRELAALGYTDVMVRHLADHHAAVLDSFARLSDVRALVADA